jgi:uncharacterized membrane protein YhaH (DUF805 family)
MTTSATEVPLSQPLYGASFGQAVSRFFKKYATFSGRASRSEFWWVALFTGLLYGVLGGILGGVIAATGTHDESGQFQLRGAAIAVVVLWALVSLALVIPGIALTVRRLHDGNFTGWLYLLHLIPSVGSIIIFVLTLLPSNPEGRRYDA